MDENATEKAPAGNPNSGESLHTADEPPTMSPLPNDIKAMIVAYIILVIAIWMRVPVEHLKHVQVLVTMANKMATLILKLRLIKEE